MSVTLKIFTLGYEHHLSLDRAEAERVLRTLKQDRPEYISFGDKVFFTRHIAAVVIV